jgi:hypothetical protein
MSSLSFARRPGRWKAAVGSTEVRARFAPSGPGVEPPLVFAQSRGQPGGEPMLTSGCRVPRLRLTTASRLRVVLLMRAIEPDPEGRCRDAAGR